ncbi:MAG: hypothetical protein HQL41_18500 [Alphaproteobacteria bacterium]|nr:hypothetical protein [Alphaproteobacteria bacterium]
MRKNRGEAITDPPLRRMHDLRWPAGFRCACGRRDARLTDLERIVYTCACGKRSTLTANTRLAGTRLPLDVWWRAAGLFARLGPTLRTHQIERHFELPHKTAWRVLDLLRRACAARPRAPLRAPFGMEGVRVVHPEIGAVVALIPLAGPRDAFLFGLPDWSVRSLVKFIQRKTKAGDTLIYGPNISYDMRNAKITQYRVSGQWHIETSHFFDKVNRLLHIRAGNRATLDDILDFAELHYGCAADQRRLVLLRGLLENIFCRKGDQITVETGNAPGIVRYVAHVRARQYKMSRVTRRKSRP